jgi:hypothetical protein
MKWLAPPATRASFVFRRPSLLRFEPERVGGREESQTIFRNSTAGDSEKNVRTDTRSFLHFHFELCFEILSPHLINLRAEGRI